MPRRSDAARARRLLVAQTPIDHERAERNQGRNEDHRTATDRPRQIDDCVENQIREHQEPRYEFDNQTISPVNFTLSPGDLTRVACTYNNTRAETVSYGESTFNEMCYFIGFAVDRPTQGGCLEVMPPLG